MSARVGGFPPVAKFVEICGELGRRPGARPFVGITIMLEVTHSHPHAAPGHGHGHGAGRPHGHGGSAAPKVKLDLTLGDRAIKVQMALAVVTSQSLTWALIATAHVVVTPLTGEPVRPWVVVVGLVLALVAGAATFASGMVQHRSGAWVERTLRQRQLRHALDLGPAMLGEEQAGAAVSMLTDSTERVATYRQTFIGPTAGIFLSPFLILLALAIGVDWVAALVLFVCLPFVPLVVNAFQKLFGKASTESRKAREALAGKFLETIQGLPTLALLRAHRRAGDELEAAGERNRRAIMRLLARNQLILFVIDAAFSLFLVTAAAVVAWWRLDAGAITAAGALALVLVAPLLTQPMEQVGGFFYIGMGGRASQRRIGGFLARKAPGSGRTPANSTDASDRSQASVPLAGAPAVRAQDLHFTYGEAPVLDGVGLDVAHGQRAVVLGPSGCGKSTLMHLLAGDLLPGSGSVAVDGVPLDAATRDDVRSRSALVRQHTWLFKGTLAHNLRIGRPEATDDELWDALARVALDTWARALPQGLDTEVGERGMAVSGGQAQRISLARAILADRDILLLDEPTSHVDLESERIILATVDELAREKTVVMVTHRPSAARHADLTLDMTPAAPATEGAR